VLKLAPVHMEELPCDRGTEVLKLALVCREERGRCGNIGKCERQKG